MQNLAIQHEDNAPDESNDIDQWTSEILQSLGNTPDLASPQTHEAISNMLNYAVEAYQQLSEQQKRIDYLETLSVTDDLTGLLNRRGFDEILRRTLSNARRYHEHGMLAYIDLNDFKIVNDTHGHEMGDFVLQKVAEALKTTIRRTDYVARLGGDEFAVLFVRADKIPTRARALKVHRLLNSLVISRGDIEIIVKASIGIEPYGPTSTSRELMRRADRAMYKEKALNKTR